MSESVVSSITLKDYSLWEKTKNKRIPFAFDLEITARCNNDCSHCYINLPAGDKEVKENELSLDEIKKITDEAVSLGTFWCLLTGGEPFLREDFFDIYLYLKKRGLLVSVFTNATLLTERHIQLFKKCLSLFYLGLISISQLLLFPHFLEKSNRIIIIQFIYFINCVFIYKL